MEVLKQYFDFVIFKNFLASSIMGQATNCNSSVNEREIKKDQRQLHKYPTTVEFNPRVSSQKEEVTDVNFI